jgi:DNA primase
VTLGFDDKDRVKQATDIVDLIGSYLQLRREGSQYVGVCPWHDDRRPSLQVNQSRQTWKCWVCDIGGDAFSFVMKRENIEFRAALEMLAERAGVPLTHRPQPKTRSGDPNDKPTLYRAMTWCAQALHRTLLHDPSAEPARRYLAMRGIHSDAVRTFSIGFVPNAWSWLTEQGRGAGFSPEVLGACGMLASGERGWYERFRGRLMFPIHDVQDRVIAFGGRVLPELAEIEEKEKGHPPAKYINSPETRLYSKSDNLFGLNLARNSLSRERHLLIVEGYTDVIAAWMAGIENVSAVCGTALNQRHIRLIKRFADRVTLVLDGDDAGQRRTNEILEQFVAADLDLRVMTLPDGQDPCDFLQTHGAAGFRARVDSAVDALEHKLRIETEGIDLIRDTHASNRALENILRTIGSSPSVSEKSPETRLREQQILTRVSRLFQIELDALHRRMLEIQRTARKPVLSVATDPAPGRRWRLNELPAHERAVLQLMLRDSILLDRVIENIPPGEFVQGPCRELYESICECYHDGHAVTFETLMLQLEDPDLKHLLDRLDEEFQAQVSKTEVEVSEQLTSVLGAFERMRREQETRSDLSRLSRPELKPEEETDILERMFQQAKERQGIQ